MGPDDPLVIIGSELQRAGYAFTTVTPETHRRVLARAPKQLASDLRDVFGWNRWFTPDLLPGRLYRALVAAGALDRQEGLSRSRLRAATRDGLLFLHSAFPTDQSNDVFFGPDTYRFLSALSWATQSRARCTLDIGCGSGAAGILLAGISDRVILADINPDALWLSAANARINGVTNCVTVLSDVCASIPSGVDLIVANPPYLIDPRGRLYRDGGGIHGTDLSLRIVKESLELLRPGGRLVLYSGSPVISGENILQAELSALLADYDCQSACSELDPDVFGEELEHPGYGRCERIAVILLTVTRGSA